VDSQLRILPPKQQGPGSQRQPRPSLAYVDQKARGEIGKRCFAEQRGIGAVVCSPRSVYLSRMQLPAWSLERSLRCCLSAEVRSYLYRIDGAYAQKAFSCQLLLLHEGEHVWSGYPPQGSTSKAARPREPEEPRPSLAYGVQRARGEKGQRCFAEQMCICAAVCCPRRVELSRIQLSEPRFEPRVRWGLGHELPSWLWGDFWGSTQNAFSCQLLHLHEGEQV
jgi:hypothetical protein